ncbi:MAG: hypothetical protein ACOCXJ_07375 [Planctomycetota bacterium]
MTDDPIAGASIRVGVRRRYRYGFRWASDRPPLDWDGYLLWFLVHGRATWSLPGETRQIDDGTCCLLPIIDGPLRLQCDTEGTQAVIWFHVCSALEQRLAAGGSAYDAPMIRALRGQLQTWLRDQGQEAALDPDRETGWRAYPPRSISPNPDDGLLVQDHPWADHSIPGYTD